MASEMLVPPDPLLDDTLTVAPTESAVMSAVSLASMVMVLAAVTLPVEVFVSGVVFPAKALVWT